MTDMSNEDVGEWKLVLSDHIISPIDIMKFIEEDVGSPLIEKDNWYTQWSMKIIGQKHVIEICENAYNPDQDGQRYCHGCKGWFHCKCLQALPKRSNRCKRDRALLLDKELIQLLCIPVFRGKQNGVSLCKDEKEDMGSNWRNYVTLDALKEAKRLCIYYWYL
ncbi:hypothetical protein EV363DRAFT_1394621 [Boletus edulis]|nr:hypothetical protein EV363DRAFT_1394621 [Boletus edulis]